MLRNKIISIVALAVIGLVSPTAASARGGGGGHGRGGFHGGGDGFRGRAGSAFPVHMPTVTIPTIMVMTTRAAAI